MGLLRPAWCKLFSVILLHFPRSTCFGCHIHPSSGWMLEARHGVERVNSHVHLHVPAACALYDAPEDGCIWHPKHVEWGKFNNVTLNNLHQADLNKPVNPHLFMEASTDNSTRPTLTSVLQPSTLAKVDDQSCVGSRRLALFPVLRTLWQPKCNPYFGCLWRQNSLDAAWPHIKSHE